MWWLGVIYLVKPILVSSVYMTNIIVFYRACINKPLLCPHCFISRPRINKWSSYLSNLGPHLLVIQFVEIAWRACSFENKARIYFYDLKTNNCLSQKVLVNPFMSIVWQSLTSEGGKKHILPCGLKAQSPWAIMPHSLTYFFHSI